MRNTHGTLAKDGQSLEGLPFCRGDPVEILDDGRNDHAKNLISVVNLHSGQSITVPLMAVCWNSTFAEQRPGAMFLFTPYGRSPGRHITAQQPSCGSYAVLVSIGTLHHVSHVFVTDEHLSVWAQRLPEAAAHSFVALQWGILSSPSADQGAELDSVSEGSLSPLTPPRGVDHFGLLRRDSAIDLHSLAESSVSGKMHQTPELGSSDKHVLYHEPLIKGVVGTEPSREILAYPKLNNAGFHVIQHDNTAALPVSHLPPCTPQSQHNKDPSLPHVDFENPWTKDSQKMQQNPTAYQVNFMTSPQSGFQQTSQGHTAQLSLGPIHGHRPGSQGSSHHFQAQSSSYPVHGSSVDFQVHRPELSSLQIPATNFSWNGPSPSSLSNPNALAAEGFPPNMMPMVAATGAPRNSTDEGADLGNAPVFYRTQDHHTMGLTAPAVSYSSDRQSDSMVSTHELAGQSQSDTAAQDTNIFRPEILVDSFMRQSRSHIEILETRQQELHSACSGDGSSSNVIVEALTIIREAIHDASGALERLLPGSATGFERSEQRLRQEIDRVVGSIQQLRQAALEKTELPQEDCKRLTEDVGKLRGWIDYMGNVYTDKVAKPGKTQASQPGTHGAGYPAPSEHAPYSGYQHHQVAHAGSSDMPPSHSFNWSEGQTTPPPDRRVAHSSGMVVSHHHQNVLRELWGNVVMSQATDPNLAPSQFGGNLEASPAFGSYGVAGAVAASPMSSCPGSQAPGQEPSHNWIQADPIPQLGEPLVPVQAGPFFGSHQAYSPSSSHMPGQPMPLGFPEPTSPFSSQYSTLGHHGHHETSYVPAAQDFTPSTPHSSAAPQGVSPSSSPYHQIATGGMALSPSAPSMPGPADTTLSAPGMVASVSSDFARSAMRPVISDRRPSLPERRLMNRERNFRHVPYSYPQHRG